jgi:hypothetical protein
MDRGDARDGSEEVCALTALEMVEEHHETLASN